MSDTLYVNKMEIVHDYEKLMAIPSIEKSINFDAIVGCHVVKTEVPDIYEEKFIVIYNYRNKPTHVLWLTNDDSEMYGRYVAMHHWNMKPEWVKPITLLTAKALGCNQRSVTIFDGRRDIDAPPEGPMYVMHTYHDLIHLEDVDKAKEYNQVASWEHSATANALDMSKYLVITTKKNVPMHVLWLTADTVYGKGVYEVNYRCKLRPEWKKDIKRLAAKALNCRQKDLIFIDDRIED